MKHHSGIELVPGCNHFIDTEEAEPEPPEGFVDSTVYRYRLKPDGTKELIGTMLAYPEGTVDHRVLEVLKGKNLKQEELIASLKADLERDRVNQERSEKYE